MAKEETKEKVLDVVERKEKISKVHLEELLKIVNKINSLQFNIGKIEGQKHTLLHDLSISQKKIIDMQSTFSKEYGTHDINVMDGTINLPEKNKDEK